MPTFQGTLHDPGTDELPLSVTFQIEEDRVRLWSARHRIGSWETSEVTIRRHTIFRFHLIIEDTEYAFNPEDPSGFASAVDVEIDLTAKAGSRFGLAERLRKVAEAG